MATHARLPNDLRLSFRIALLGDFFKDMLLNGLSKLTVSRDKFRALWALLDSCLQCLLLHRELVVVDFALVLIFQCQESVIDVV